MCVFVYLSLSLSVCLNTLYWMSGYRCHVRVFNEEGLFKEAQFLLNALEDQPDCLFQSTGRAHLTDSDSHQLLALLVHRHCNDVEQEMTGCCH